MCCRAGCLALLCHPKLLYALAGHHRPVYHQPTLPTSALEINCALGTASNMNPALVSIIGLDDMVRKASMAAGATRMPFTFYVVVAINFLLITTVSIYLLKYLEEKYSIGVRRD